ncbi:hypothetical protein FNF29_02021 [Cafeteria roenbergensis]|uniref:Uncharacterized protein n=1 Tax=Cafeteria roenbergensis TaxID=33653 RepID=A0A5A8CRV4_CAFRO|nr:hypothetical protein FNF29_02021 [Cafeteria roenbergensis]KAA0162685.1 hypothetical protein FNF28_04628 [Cafeteria roenbergensis]|eukprot:KAA0154880.1 hypothetical protein FNF29_02021 [Cafeteria roenbergensis]
MESNDSAASSGPGPEDKRAGVGRPVFSPHVWGVFVHGFNAHRWSLGPGYSGKDGKLARVYCHADGPAKGTPRVGTVFGALPELFQGGKQALMVAYRCTHDFEPTARAVLEALAADLESRGLSLADCVVITHSMGGLVVCSALGEALDAAGGFKHMARAAGRRTGEVLAPGVGVLSGAGVAGAGIQLLSSSMKKGSWLGALAGTALVVGGGAAALWAGTSADVARAGGDAASATAEAMTEAAAERTRRFLAPMVDPTAPRHAALLRRIRRAAVRLGSWLPVLVMSCALPDQAGKGTTQPGFRNLPPDEEALWAALSRSEAHRLCVREVVPKRFRQALGVGPEALVGGNRFCATSAGVGAGAAAVEAEAGGRAGEGLHRRHRSTGGLDSTIALDRALDAFNRAGDAAAAPAEADAPLRDFARVAPATEEDEAASALRYFLGRGGGAAAADAKEAQEAWLADLVQWSLRTAAKEASAACAAGGGAAGADDCDEPACGFAAMAHHVTSHGTVFMEAEQRAFVQATLESLPLEDASATPDELLRTLDEVRCDLRDDGVEL